MWNRFNKSKSKMGNQRTETLGLSFGSKLESSVFLLLKKMEDEGEIVSIKVQDSVYLTQAKILYKPDFRCENPDGTFFWVEAKGFKTPVWAIKKRLWEHYGPGKLYIYEGSYKNPKLVEILTSEGNIDQ